MDFSTCTVEQLWRFVAAHLESRGIGVVLVGGAVVSVYTEGAYVSGDLDFVRETFFFQDVEGAMAEVGFHKEGRHYRHPSCPHPFVEFVAGPLMDQAVLVASSRPVDWDKIERWCQGEGPQGPEAFIELRRRVGAQPERTG